MSIITVNAGGSISSAITSAVSGDIIEVEAAATFDISSPLSLKNHGSSSNPITIRSTAYASLPTGRVGPSDVANMPKIRQTGINGAFVDVSGGAYWVLDGLEVTDNLTSDSGFFFDLRHGGKTTITRTYCHPKETNPDWTRAVYRGIWYEGSGGLTVTKSYFTGFLGFSYSGSITNTADLSVSCFLLSISGKNVTLTNNFLSAWYASIFTGGSSSATPDQTATFSGTPTTTSATFSNVTGLSLGDVIRIDLKGVGTKSGSSFTRTSGTALVNADCVGPYGIGFNVGDGISYNLTAVSGDSFTIDGIGNMSDGSKNWTAYQAVMIDTIAGSNVTYHAVGNNGLTRAPNTTTDMAGWAVGDNNNAADWVISQNTFWNDPEFVNYLISIAYPTAPGKGIWEMKHMKRLTLDGNRFTGYPNSLFMRLYNQDGSEPWSTVQDITITNNYFKTDAGVTDFGGHVFSINLGDPYRSAQPGKNVTISNNLIIGWEGLIFGQYGTGVSVYHNTVLNTTAGVSYHSGATYDVAMASPSGWVFRDNLLSYRNYGAQCLVGGGGLSDCWPSGTWSKNLVVDTEGVGVTGTTWGTGSILTPVPTTFSSSGVGFTDSASGNYRLLSSSIGYHAATEGGTTDVGINQDTLEAALGSSGSGTQTSTPRVKLISICT